MHRAISIENPGLKTCLVINVHDSLARHATMFRYATFWRAFRELGEPTADVICHEYLADYHAIKYHSTTSQAGVFKHRGMLARRLSADDPLVTSQHPRYQHGAFVVYPRNETPAEEERAKRRKELYIVDLTRHELTDNVLEETRTIYTADHFSFIVNDNDKTGNKLHMHRTKYLPKTFEQGNVDHTPGHVPLEFPLESPEALRERIGKLAFETRWIYAILTRPDDMQIQSSRTNQVEANRSGGGRRSGRRRRQRRVATFDDIFLNLPVDRLLVFAFPEPENAAASSISTLTTSTPNHHVTVFVRRRAPHMSRGRNDICFSFSFSSQSVADEPRLRARVAQAFKGVERWQFEAPARTALDEDEPS